MASWQCQRRSKWWKELITRLFLKSSSKKGLIEKSDDKSKIKAKPKKVATSSKSKKAKTTTKKTQNKKKLWYSIKKRPDVIIFEGWCVGARAEKNNTLKKAINSLEKIDDKKLIWRKYVNQQLKSKYEKLYSQLSCLLFLKANNFSLLQQWRLTQEKKLWLKNSKSSNNKIMSKKDVFNFMQTYQRITQNMFRYAPKYASIILNLNSNHQIKSVVYKKKWEK